METGKRVLKNSVLAMVCILFVMFLCGDILWNDKEIVHAACTKNCGICSGNAGWYNYECIGCGATSSSYFNCCGSVSSYWIRCDTCGGDGKVWKACTEGDWVYHNATGIVDTSSNVMIPNGKRTKSCKYCGAHMKTQYYLDLPCGPGIESTTGSGWYDDGATGYADCIPKTGYYFARWGDNDTRQSWTNVMNQPKSFTAIGEPYSYTQTINHYLWDVDTSSWICRMTTYGTGTYDSLYYPSYTTPSGYYNYSLDWESGWLVSGAGTFHAYYYPNLYTVSYQDNGGWGSPAAHNFYYNSTAYLSWSTPTRTGYTFSHWLVLENGATMSPGQQIPRDWGSVTLQAQWTPNQYVLTVNPNGGTFSDGTTGMKRANPNLVYTWGNWWDVSGFIPTKTGYTFTGFYTAASGGTKVYANNGICIQGTPYWNYGNQYCYAGNLDLYAQWAVNIYTIYLDNQSATFSGTNAYYEKYDHGNYSNLECTKPISSITIPTRRGYIFGGYYTQPDGGGIQYINELGAINSTSIEFTQNITLYAKWIPNRYIITLSDQGAEIIGTSVYYEKYDNGNYSDINCTNGILGITLPKRTGYTFGGYYTQPNGAGEKQIDENGTILATSVTFAEDTTLYAKWTINRYSVTYDGNGGTSSVSSIQVTYGMPVDLAIVAKKTGYKFIGWGITTDSKMPLKSLSQPANNLTLYAMYTRDISDVENHTFPEYYATSDVADDEVYLVIWITENDEIYRYYPLTYQKEQDVNDMVYHYSLPETDIASFVNGRDFSYKIIALDNARNYAVLYKGDSRFPGMETEPKPDAPEQGPIPPEEYTQTVEYYKRVPNQINPSWITTINVAVEENTLFTPDYMIPPDGYKKAEMVYPQGYTITDGSYMVKEAATTKIYYKPNTYVLTLDANGGKLQTEIEETSSITKDIVFDDYYGYLNTPIRTGYTFTEWNTTSDGKGERVISSGTYTNATDTMIYAQWVPKIYQITLNNQGAKINGTSGFYEKFDNGNYLEMGCFTSISKIEKPEKTGYTFGGYYTERKGQGTCYVDAAGNILSTENTFIEDTTLYAYWIANTYTIKFHANDGMGSMSDINIKYDETVSLSSNTFTRIGYTFSGWSTTMSGPKQYEEKETVINLSEENGDIINLYAVWSINSYKVTYDYKTNGGTFVSKTEGIFDYSEAINLEVAAEKTDSYIGWEFVGWNTDSMATTILTPTSVYFCSECESNHSVNSMPTHDVILYAIYKKTITLTIQELAKNDVVIQTLSSTIYNQEQQAEFEIESGVDLQERQDGWVLQGWTPERGAAAPAIVGIGSKYVIKENTTIYAVYISNVTLTYDTNGSVVTYEAQTKVCYHNASGENRYPVFDVLNVPTIQKYSFVKWDIVSGVVENTEGSRMNSSMPKESIILKTDASLRAIWDEYPIIEAYNRYFTLEEARSGIITESELLKKVVATDREAKTLSNPEGILENNIDVIVKNYDASNFTEVTKDAEIAITYQAIDSYGNVVTKTVMITVTDTTTKKSSKKTYVRFISDKFLIDETGSFIPSNKGGLEETSIWRTDATYNQLLRDTILNTKTDVEKKEVSVLGEIWKIEVAGSGEWTRKEDTWVFTKEEIEKIKSTIKNQFS